MTSGTNIFSQNSKNKGNYPKISFFLKKTIENLLQSKNPKKTTKNKTKNKKNNKKQNKKQRKTTKNKTKSNKKQQKNKTKNEKKQKKTKQKTKKTNKQTNKQTNKKQVHMHFFRKYSMFRRSIPLKVDKAMILLLFILNNSIYVKFRHYYEY